MIRVLVYIEEFNRGGIETFWMNVLRAVDPEKLRIDFLVLKQGEYDYAAKAEALGASVYFLLDAEGANAPDTRLEKLKVQMGRMSAWMHDHCTDYEVFHVNASHLANAYPLIWAARRAGMRHVVLHSHNSNEDNRTNRIAHGMFRPFLGLLKLDGMIACSEIAGLWMFGRKRRFVILRNGIDFGEFSFDAIERKNKRAELHIGETGPVLIYVARLTETKNQRFLVDVLSECKKADPAVHLLLCGAGEDEPYLRQRFHEAGLGASVSFLGVRGDVAQLLSAADCFVFPSKYEGLPVVSIEAQANGIPLVMSDCISEEALLSNKTMRIGLEQGSNRWAVSALQMSQRRFEKPEYKDGFYDYDIHRVVESLSTIYRGAIG